MSTEEQNSGILLGTQNINYLSLFILSNIGISVIKDFFFRLNSLPLFSTVIKPR